MSTLSLEIRVDETIREWPSNRVSRSQRLRVVFNPIAIKIIRHHLKGFDSEILETIGREQVKTSLRIQQHEIATTAQHELSEGSDPRLQQRAHHIGAIA